MLESNFSYLPKVHKYNHNNVTAKQLQVTYYLSSIAETEVNILVERMNIVLDNMNATSDKTTIDAYKAALNDIRHQLIALEYFDAGSKCPTEKVTNET